MTLILMLIFHPEVFHYRREHAPNTRNLGSDVSIALMHRDFQKKFPAINVSYESYRRKAAKNISFIKLGHEECDMFMDIPKKTSKNHVRNAFSGKIILIVPKNRANFIGNNLKLPLILKQNAFLAIYKKSPCFTEWICLKRLFFLQRLIAFNETFVPLGKLSKNNKSFAVVWHEEISKRSKEDIISTFHAFLKFNRDANNIIIWMNSCASQNKNWTLFTFLVEMMNSNEIQANIITFNYFEPGQTFISADSFHHQIELSMKRKQKIYDFSDFLDAVGSSCKGNVDVKAMNFNDFCVWKDVTSQTKLKKDLENRPYLSDMV
ncbi:uncharacterized protein LOC126738363 isoform X1 [Anthonomus grandis grandis]|uniref:uncharacterized protein LOC126738363 isoform X1 n=1 Tax=Anthonomus grandis grandis TaxID=2921223 RepID=UPI0021664E56|nr:uncharacterized protein LOC126738363 isoform X1 [Anthonomus grandis grandis]XP_050299622.1 uncharacterized protein LOC126738363 isoform X1 [Anthonomus grandis grandis]